MSDAHFSTYGRGGKWGPRESEERRWNPQKSPTCPDGTVMIDGKATDISDPVKYRELMEERIAKILRKDHKLGPVIAKAILDSKEGLQPFTSLTIMDKELGRVAKIMRAYPDVYTYIYWLDKVRTGDMVVYQVESILGGPGYGIRSRRYHPKSNSWSDWTSC